MQSTLHARKIARLHKATKVSDRYTIQVQDTALACPSTPSPFRPLLHSPLSCPPPSSTYKWAHTHPHRHGSPHINTHTHKHTCAHAHTYTHMCTWARTHAHARTHMHTHTHSLTHTWRTTKVEDVSSFLTTVFLMIEIGESLLMCSSLLQTLARVIATVVKFSDQQTKNVIDKAESRTVRFHKRFSKKH